VGIVISIRTLRLAAMGLCGLAATSAAYAAPATTPGTARAEISSSLSVLKTADLEFGNIIAGPAAGTVVVNPYTDARTITTVTGAGGTVNAAKFTGIATPGSLAWVRWPTGNTILNRVGGGATMIMDQLRVNSVFFVFGGVDPRIVPADGRLDIRFGGRLNVKANQMEGVYSGTFTITVDYQ